MVGGNFQTHEKSLVENAWVLQENLVDFVSRVRKVVSSMTTYSVISTRKLDISLCHQKTTSKNDY